MQRKIKHGAKTIDSRLEKYRFGAGMHGLAH